MWAHIDDSKVLEKIWLRPSLSEIFDMQWSSDCAYIILGAVETKVSPNFPLYYTTVTILPFQAEIMRLSTRQSLMLPGHNSYVQGVSWDPLNQFVVTQSADRTCKVHLVGNLASNEAVVVDMRAS